MPFLDIDTCNRRKFGKPCSGDVFVSRRSADGSRVCAVLAVRVLHPLVAGFKHFQRFIECWRVGQKGMSHRRDSEGLIGSFGVEEQHVVLQMDMLHQIFP